MVVPIKNNHFFRKISLIGKVVVFYIKLDAMARNPIVESP